MVASVGSAPSADVLGPAAQSAGELRGPSGQPLIPAASRAFQRVSLERTFVVGLQVVTFFRSRLHFDNKWRAHAMSGLAMI
jgi:hypothetical protein